jgi:hypothetical protein
MKPMKRVVLTGNVKQSDLKKLATLLDLYMQQIAREQPLAAAVINEIRKWVVDDIEEGII